MSFRQAMSDLFAEQGPSAVPLELQIAEVRRELQMRYKVYPRWIDAGRLTREAGAQQITRLEAVLETLETLEKVR